MLNEHCFCLLPHVLTADRAPLWPFIVAAIYAITGPINFYARLFLVLVDTGTCLLIYLYARDLFGKRVGLITGLLAACYTGVFIYDGWLYTESLYIFLVLVFTYSLYLLQRTEQRRWIIISGVSFALAALTRPNGLFTFIMLLAWAVIVIRAHLVPWRLVVQALVIISLITFGFIAPWTLRNYRMAHVFIPVATGGSVVLVGAYNDTVLTDKDLLGRWAPGNLIRPPLIYHAHPSYEGEAENAAYAIHWIETHMSSMPYLLSLHFINMWTPYTSEDGLPVIEFPTRTSSRIVWFMMEYMPLLVISLATIGLLVTWRKWRDLQPAYLMILLTIIECLVFYGSMRFRAPIEPFLLLLAGGTIWRLLQVDSNVVRSLFARIQPGKRSADAR